MAVVVRPVRAGDGAARSRLWRDSGRFFAGVDPDTAQEPDPRGLVEWLEEVYERRAADPAALMLLAEVDGEIAGEAAARLTEPLPSARWQLQRDLGRRGVHVDVLTVAEVHRRSGVGTALMAAVERWALEHGADVVTLETNRTNPTSMPFYEQRMGYTQHAVIFRKQLRPPT